MRGLFLLLCVCLVQSGLTKKQSRESYDYELSLGEPGTGSILLPPQQKVLQPGYSVGGPLANIAKGAAEQAHTQLSNQESAAGQAAYVAKNTLAQAASQSAATAAAALTGKQIVVQGLEQQSRDAHVAVDNEALQLQQAERSANAAKNAAKQAMHQVQVITAALNAAQVTADRAQQAAAEAEAELAAQTTMVGQAKARAETVDEQLISARIDYDTTQTAADKAAIAATAAQNNAAAAGAKVADTAGTSALLTHEPATVTPLPKLPEQPVLKESPGYALLSEGPAYGAGGPILAGPAGHQEAALKSEGLRYPIAPEEIAAQRAQASLEEADGLRLSGLLQKAGDPRLPITIQETELRLPAGYSAAGLKSGTLRLPAAALRAPGLSLEVGAPLQSPLFTLANSLPIDGYETKEY
ncbi:cilia- and flagella-associated protein 91-like [Ceratina calcarata]|uniref:Cilia- and flagella-associated protein 91-like n=2 Tax=Ceratina calcarata TaxID=156304 RepID=A0AAJ7J938_9HYME|nr:cilia- and flagella-associated protein 91-like [Ceratina calcarata]